MLKPLFKVIKHYGNQMNPSVYQIIYYKIAQYFI